MRKRETDPYTNDGQECFSGCGGLTERNENKREKERNMKVEVDVDVGEVQKEASSFRSPFLSVQ
jgi:hypothetical protein